jgi:hypothetical protein
VESSRPDAGRARGDVVSAGGVLRSNYDSWNRHHEAL